MSSVQDIDALFILFLGRGLESMNILRANVENAQVSEKKYFLVDGLVFKKSKILNESWRASSTSNL